MKAPLLFCILFVFSTVVFSQSTQNDIAPSTLPPEVKTVLDKYIEILNSNSHAECASRFVEIAGGSLVNEDGSSLRSSVAPYSLKKDYNNIKFYKQPAVITRVNKSHSNGSGFGASAIAGEVYKIWIAKKEKVSGLPAPISIMFPENHATITKPKVVKIGSL